jgi:hypothetical protein
MGNRAFSILITFILILGSVAEAGSGKQGSITLKSGKVFDNLWFTVDNYYKTIQFTYDGEKKTVSFSDIALITNKDGEDRTEALLGRSYYLTKQGKPPTDSTIASIKPDSIIVAPPSESFTVWKSKTDVVHSKREPHEYSFGVRVHGNFGIPAGSYYDGIDAGAGGGLDISIPVGDEIAIWGQINRLGMSFSLPVNSFGFSAWSYMIGAEYFHYGEGRANRTRFPSVYAFSGLGSISHTASAAGFGGSRVSYSENKFALSLGGGTVVPASPAVGIDLGAEIYVLYGKGYNTSSPYNETFGIIGTVIQFHAGLAFAIK